MEKTEETGNVGWTVQCRHSILKAVQESAQLYNEWQELLISQICLCRCALNTQLAVSYLPFNA